MIEKMTFVNIIGPKKEIDNVASNYLTKYEIQLENALSELRTTENLIPYDDINPYKEQLSRVTKFLPYIEDLEGILPKEDMTYDEAVKFIRTTHHDLKESEFQKDNLKTELNQAQDRLDSIVNFKSLNFDLQTVLNYKFIKFRFGRIAKDYYHKLEKYFYESSEAIFLEGGSDSAYVYGVYFASLKHIHEVDAVFASLRFERIYLSDTYHGTPREACADYEARIYKLKEEIKAIDEANDNKLKEIAPEILAAYNLITKLTSAYDIRRLAALTDRPSDQYFILCGWMSEQEAPKLQKDLEAAKDTKLLIEGDVTSSMSKPPTKLKNPWFLKPFEMFVKMYGLPDYNEIDPTWFIAITYTFIFGVMFGDVGQGLCLVVGGFLLYKFKKIPLAAIIGCAGVFSTLFGFMFGSVFGFEDVIEAHWLRPIDAMSNLPFVGSLNTIFIVTIAFGMFLVLCSMVLHIINGVRAGEKGSALFDPNGVAGLVFYGAIILVLVLFMTGHALPGGILLGILFGVPLILIVFKGPLENAMAKKKEIMPKNKGMFFTEAFFELFEMLLSYFSNTLSFVRIGAFAVSHAAMMEVVLMLAGAESGSPNILVVVLGNIFVCGMEGLIVGIQVLRLEYYEMFSRFYKGGGREFKPYGSDKKNG